MEDKNLAKAYKIVFGMMVLFFGSAISSSLIGKYIDRELNSAPYGLMLSMVASYLISFSIAYYYYVTNYRKSADDHS